MKLFLQTILPLVILAGVLVYLGDFLSLKYSIPKRPVYGSVQVRELYAIKLKNKSTEYDVQPPQMEECVNSMFGHFGDPPCWYLKRNTRQRIDIDSGTPQVLGK
jgi:hypothetical protein